MCHFRKGAPFKYDSVINQEVYPIMILMVCIDDDNGMCFANRRQSQDRTLRERLLRLSGGILWMDAYSAKQFSPEESARFVIDEAFLENAGKGDFCFAETTDVAPYEEKAEKIMLYRWNRKYPASLHFSIPLAEHGWKCVSTEEWEGYSHEKITEEVYVK